MHVRALQRLLSHSFKLRITTEDTGYVRQCPPITNQPQWGIKQSYDSRMSMLVTGFTVVALISNKPDEDFFLS